MKHPVIGIIGGKGHMGKLFASFFKERGIPVLISDKKTSLTNKELTKKSDIVIVSVPIDKTGKVIKEIIPQMRKTSALADFTSVKEASIKEMLEAKCEVFGMHPMFGDSNPVPGQNLIMCPTKKSHKWYKWMKDFLAENQVQIHEMSAKEHDKMMATAQGLMHFAEITLGNGLTHTKLNDLLKYISKATELKLLLSARVLDQDPGLYANIQIQNPHTAKILKQYRKTVDDLMKIVDKKDVEAFKKYFSEAQKHYGPYTKKAFKESSYLIDKLIEHRRKKTTKAKTKPTKSHIAVLGPKNTFSDLAADKYGTTLKKYFSKDIDEIFDLVAKGRVAEGIAPVENKLHGTVRETIDNLFHKNVHIEKQISLPIHHCLIALPHASAKDIKTIFSHTQALNQCKKYLKKHYPKAEKMPFGSTAGAIEKLIASQDKSRAVIAPEIAALNNNLKILAKNIEDEHDNTTTFLIIKKGPSLNHKGSKTSIAFHFSADAPGSLFSVFQDFADAKINLTKIESRPTKAKFGDYIFYLDFEGSPLDPAAKKVLKIIEKKVAKLKILGTF